MVVPIPAFAATVGWVALVVGMGGWAGSRAQFGNTPDPDEELTPDDDLEDDSSAQPEGLPGLIDDAPNMNEGTINPPFP